MKLSDKIRILRKARGLSQEQLGYSLSRVNEDGISRQTVSDWENGNFEPKLDNIRDLADVLNVSFDALLDENVDLNDGETLYKVLNRINHNDNKDNISNSFSYSIYAYQFDKRALITVIIAPVLLIVGIIGIIMFVLGLTSDDAMQFSTWLGLAFVFIGIIGVVPLFAIPRSIKSLKSGKYVASFGSLSNDYLHISSYNSVSNTIFIPVSKIEKMELGENANKRHGPVIITIKDRIKPLILIDIKEPQKLIDVFNSLDSYIENPDEIKIL